MKKLLILGAKGTLGQALITEFQPTYEVVAWDREDIDVTDTQTMQEKITELKPDIVINATAINAVDKIEEDPTMFELAKNINGIAVGELAKIATDLGSIFVHYSTDYVFDGEAGRAYLETDTPNPISKYAETKLLGETLTEQYGEKFYIIRLSRLFGKAGSSEMSKRSFVDTMLALATQKDHLDVVNDQTGSPTYAPDLADFTRRLIEENKAYGIYHGTNDGGCTWYEWAKKVFELRNITIDLAPVSHTQFPRPAKAPKYSVLENTKMPKQRSWEDALQEYLGGYFS